ncbi:MAG: epoxyqueuosine reductase, partial [Planctomycetota bacterium]|nr:epoxyqueuosine reductase [Planctomycetota bacterium]
MTDISGLARDIRDKALALGFSHCGIIPIGDLAGYDGKVSERILRFPESAPAFASGKRHHATLACQYPWAKSVVVCVRRYGKYRLPAAFRGRIAKFYLTDARRNPLFPDHYLGYHFAAYLSGLGMRTAEERDQGIVPYRWAAMQAGLGVIRRNNFLYTRHGSWVTMEAWLIDREMEAREDGKLGKCPNGCRLCQDSCPTRALAEPFMTNRETCVSNVTTWKGRDMPREKCRKGLGGWLYGCDDCQDACPFNQGKWADEEEAPGLSELAEEFSLEKVATADYSWLRRNLADRFWYIGEDELWKW